MPPLFNRRIIAAMLIGASVLCASIPVYSQPEAPEARKEYAEDFHPALKGEAKEVDGLLIYGPDAADCVKFEPDGLRITLPTGCPKVRPGTGVITDFGVKGDFEITVAFEILQETKAGKGQVKLVIVPSERAEPEVWHKASQNRAVLGRDYWGGGKFAQLFADPTKWTGDIPKDQWGNEDFSKVEVHPAIKRLPSAAKAGRFRLVRTGAMLSFLTSEDADKEFIAIHQSEFGVKDLKNVRVLAATEPLPASIDLRITDLRIRADGFVKQAVATIPPAPPPSSGSHWGLIALAIIVPLLLIVGSVGAWLILRMRGKAAPVKRAVSAPTAIAFECHGCGKRLKVKAERAGTKVKCPQCGKAVEVPSAEELA